MTLLLIIAAATKTRWWIVYVPFLIGALYAFNKANDSKLADRLGRAFMGGMAGIAVIGAIFWVAALLSGNYEIEE